MGRRAIHTLLALVAWAVLVSGTALVALWPTGVAIAQEPVNVTHPPPSDFVTDGVHTRLELVLDHDARGPTDLVVRTSAGQFGCHVPCALDVPRGMIHLLGEGLDQQFELELPVARFRLRAGAPVPWLEALGGIGAGLALGGVGTYVALTSTQSDEVVGGVALVVLGVAVFGLCVALLAIGIAEQSGSAELDTFVAALREGVVRF